MIKLFKATIGLVLGCLFGLIIFSPTALADIVVIGQSAGGSSIGSPVTGGTATRVLFVDGSGNLAGDADLTFSTDTLTVTKVVSSGVGLFSGAVTFGSAADAANAIAFNETAGQITWEGAAADTAEHRLAVTVNAGFDTLTTIPATGATQTVMVLENAQTITGAKTFNGGVTLGAQSVQANNTFFSLGSAANGPAIIYNTTLTPDAGMLLAGSVSNSLVVQATATYNNDYGNGPCGTAVCTNPTLTVADKDNNQTDYHSLSVAGLQGSFRATLTESSATAAIQIPVAASAATGGEFHYCVFAADATDQQQRCSFVRFAVSNKAGTETCGLSNDAGAADASITETEDGNAASISSGTLTYTIACDTAPTNAANITINAVSSLAQTTLQVRGTVNLVGPGEALPQ